MKSLFAGKSRKAVAIFVAVAAAAAITTVSFAGGDDGHDDGASVPGVPVIGDGSDATPSSPGGDGVFEPIVTNPGAFDPTILTKFIPAATFTVQDTDALAYDDSRICVHVDAANVSSTARLRAPVELPDGAKILRYSAFGSDTDATNMTFYMDKTVVAFDLIFGNSITETSFPSFDSSAASGIFGLSNASDLNENTGDTSGFLFSYTTRYYELYVSMPKAASTNHSFCGAQVTYQVPAVANAVATAFYPISPVRAFDSRIGAYTGSGLLAPNTSKVVNIKDGHNNAGAVNLVDAVPSGATAVTYNITVTGTTGPNFLQVTPGDASSFTASIINFTGAGVSLANASTVAIAADRTIKIWGGDQSGSTHVIIDITGYYAPLPNMGN